MTKRKYKITTPENIEIYMDTRQLWKYLEDNFDKELFGDTFHDLWSKRSSELWIKDGLIKIETMNNLG